MADNQINIQLGSANQAGASSSRALEGFGGVPTEAEELQKLQEALAPLLENGVPVATFRVEDLVPLGFTVDQFKRHTRILTAQASVELRDQILVQALVSQVIPAAVRCQLRHVSAVCDWMRTPRGQQAVKDSQTSVKRQKRAAGGRTVEEICLLAAFNQQRADYAAVVKELRKAAEADIAELRRQMTLRQDALEKELAELQAEYQPAGLYP